jgi:hypothetical protein
MSTAKPRALIAIEYYEAAQADLRSLPPGHFMEAIGQGTQRKITLESLDLVHAVRPEVQLFNELLVQYPHRRQKKPARLSRTTWLSYGRTPSKRTAVSTSPCSRSDRFG